MPPENKKRVHPSAAPIAMQDKKARIGGLSSSLDCCGEKMGSSSVSESNSASIVKSTAECSICLELMALAHSVAPCGHSFCYTCILDWMKQNKNCPTCSSVVENIIPCRVLDDIIQASGVASATDMSRFEKRFADGLVASKKTPASTIVKPREISAPKKKGIRSFFEVVDLS